MEGLTDKQDRVLDYVRTCVTAFGKPPTVREICKHIGVRSSCTVWRHIEALERKGYIVRSKRYAYRSYWPKDQQLVEYPDLLARNYELAARVRHLEAENEALRKGAHR